MTPFFYNILCAPSHTRRTTADFYDTSECPDKNALIKLSPAGPISTQALDSVNPYHLPKELWAHVFLFFSSKQELAPLQYVSILFKALVNASSLPNQALDYASPKQQIKSYRVDHNGYAKLPFIILSSGFAVTVEGFYDLCSFDLKNCRSKFISPTLFPEKKSLSIPHSFLLFHFKNNIVITNSYYPSYKLHVWDIEKGTCIRTLTGYQGPVDSLAKLNDSLVASISRAGEVKIWDIEKGECTKEISITAFDTKPSIIYLVQENSLLIMTEHKMACLNLDNSDFVEKDRGTIRSVHVFSDHQVILNYGLGYAILENKDLFEDDLPMTIVTSHFGGGFSNIRVLPGGDIAFLTIRNPKLFSIEVNPVHMLGICHVNQDSTTYRALNTNHPYGMELLEDGRIAVRMSSWGSETIEIFSFAKKEQEFSI